MRDFNRQEQPTGCNGSICSKEYCPCSDGEIGRASTGLSEVKNFTSPEDFQKGLEASRRTSQETAANSILDGLEPSDPRTN